MTYTDRFTLTTGMRTTLGLAAAGASLVAVCYGLARFAYGLFVPTFRAEFGLDAATAGAIAAGSYAGYCVAVVGATLATGRWGARRVAVVAGLCATAGTGLVAAAPGALVLAVGVVLAGSSTGMASPPLAQAVARVVPAGREPRVQAVVNAGTGLGVLVSGPVALLTAGGWRWAWAAFALTALAVTAWCASAVPAGSADDVSAAPSVRPSALPPGAVRLSAAAVLLGVGSAAVWTFGKDVVDAASGGGPTGVVMWIALGVAGLLGALTGDLTVRFGVGPSWRVAMLLLAAATGAVALGAGIPVVAVAAGAVFGAVYIALTGVLLLCGARLLPGEPALGVGAAFLFLALGQAVGAPALGLVADAVGAPGAFGVAAAVTVAGALLSPAVRRG